MPIHHQGYRRSRRERAPGGRTWWVIATAGLRGLFRTRAFLGLLLISLVPFFARVVQMYASASLPQAAFLAPTPETFRNFLRQQDIFVFLIAVYVGSGLIANDRRTNALQIYRSKPLTRIEYATGKMAILLTCLLLVTWLPAIALLAVQVIFSGTVAFLLDNVYLVVAITAASALQALTVSSVMLALSSMSKSSRAVGIAYAGLIFFSRAIYGVLFALTRDSSWAFVSFSANLSQLGRAIFRSVPLYDIPWQVSLVIVIGANVVSALILERRIRGVDVVA